jgi:hypothetical protein
LFVRVLISSRFKLADLSADNYKIYAAGLCVGIFNRITDKIAEDAVYKERERKGGFAVLDALVAFEFPEGEPANTKEIGRASCRERVWS